MIQPRPYIRGVSHRNEATREAPEYPFGITAIKACEDIIFHPDVTFFIGGNGSGKSTLLEAVAYGFNPEDGTQCGLFEVHNSRS